MLIGIQLCETCNFESDSGDDEAHALFDSTHDAVWVIREFRDPNECGACGDEGEIWFDVEMPNGRVLEDSRPCGVCQ